MIFEHIGRNIPEMRIRTYLIFARMTMICHAIVGKYPILDNGLSKN